MTSLGEAITLRAGSLAEHGSPTARLDAELLAGHALGLTRAELYVQLPRALSDDELQAVDALVARRAQREPVAYILGRWGFRRLDLAVDRRVLIPRPETEELVSVCLELMADRPAPAVLDVGTGSGAIALALAQELPGARVTATDISPGALEVARGNAADLGLPVEWLESDLLTALAGHRFDLVVSNPPYISPAELATLEPDVRAWEPRLALEAAGDGLGLLRALAVEAPNVLAPGGWIALECGAGQAAAVGQALTGAGLAAVAARLDFAGIERFVIGRRP